jgi:hypothetical protein
VVIEEPKQALIAGIEEKMEQGNNGARNKKRASFVEVISSIRFDRGQSANADAHYPETGFAGNQSQHYGVAAPDDYKQLVRSSN